MEAKDWFSDVLDCINQIPDTVFTLEDVYQFESILAEKHPQNNNIRPKIRQQLQLLRDHGFVEFLEPGVYKKQ